jgi:hypothetical protein
MPTELSFPLNNLTSPGKKIHKFIKNEEKIIKVGHICPLRKLVHIFVKMNIENKHTEINLFRKLILL